MNKTIIIVLAVAFAVAALASVFASAFPDGLEKVAEKLGFIEVAKDTPGAMPDYMFPGIQPEVWATIIAGIIGTALMFLLFLGAAYALKISHRSAS